MATRPIDALLLCALIACGTQAPAPSEPAPDFTVQRLDGSVVRLSDFRGRYVLLDFWATWCAPCILEIPELNTLYAGQDSSNFQILAISLDEEPPDELARWVREHDMQYPVVLGTLEIAEQYGAFQFPYHVLIGPDGDVLERLSPGFHDREELEALLARHSAG